MRENRNEKIWIGAFFLILCGGPLLWAIWGKNIDYENYENRVAAEKPVFSPAQIETFPEQYEAY